MERLQWHNLRIGSYQVNQTGHHRAMSEGRGQAFAIQELDRRLIEKFDSRLLQNRDEFFGVQELHGRLLQRMSRRRVQVVQFGNRQCAVARKVEAR